MALAVADRVLETCSAPGTGTVSLLGAITGYQTFVAGVGNGNTTYYAIADQSGSRWEVGIGTVTSGSPNTLARNTILASSNGGSLTDFNSGTQNVFVTYPAEKAVYLSAAGNVSSLGTISSGTWNGMTIAIGYGGTGQTSQQAAMNALAGAVTSTYYLRGDGADVKMSAIQAGDVPTLNQNTTGSAASLSISGQTGLMSVTGLTSTNRVKTVRDAADTILELGGSYTPSGTWNWTSAIATWPTFNQDTTGSAVYWKTSGTGKAAISGPSTGQTRTYTFPDADATIATIDDVLALSIALG